MYTLLEIVVRLLLWSKYQHNIYMNNTATDHEVYKPGFRLLSRDKLVVVMVMDQ